MSPKTLRVTSALDSHHWFSFDWDVCLLAVLRDSGFTARMQFVVIPVLLAHWDWDVAATTTQSSAQTQFSFARQAADLVAVSRNLHGIT